MHHACIGQFHYTEGEVARKPPATKLQYPISFDRSLMKLLLDRSPEMATTPRTNNAFFCLTCPALRPILLLCYHLPSTNARDTAAHTPAAMALSCSRALLLILLVAAVTPVPAATEQQRVLTLTTTVIECYPASAPTNATTNGTAFRVNVLSLLAKLPSAAAPTGFASLHSSGRSANRALARGLCFGVAAPLECRRCLSMAATNLTSRCDAHSTRRAGIWSDGCFVSYADTNATTPTDDAFRARAISGPADALAHSAADADLQRLAGVAQYLPIWRRSRPRTTTCWPSWTRLPWRATTPRGARCACWRSAPGTV